jgi:HlyD family secretion protein
MDSTAGTLIVAALVAISIAYTANNLTQMATRENTAKVKRIAPVAEKSVTPTQAWSASAPGRVEPWGGEIRVAAESSGRVERVIVKQNDRVAEGDLLVLLDDKDQTLRLRAAEAMEALRKRERDAGTVGKSVQDRRKIEDDFAAAERAMHLARMRLDQALLDVNAGTGGPASVAAARARISLAQAELRKKRDAWEAEKVKENAPLPTRTESALTAARTELALAEQALERTRIRAPADGTVLQLDARLGESISPTTATPIAVIGNLQKLRVKAEVEERDISKIRVGQQVIVKSNSFPDQEFVGKVFRIAKSLGGAQLGPRGPRRPSDLDVLETLIEMESAGTLLPGMRVDVYFRPDATAEGRARTRTN